MELKLAWLYSDLLELYGDGGNITIIKYRCSEIGIDLKVDEYSIGDKFSALDYDLVYLGGCSDRELDLFYEDILSRREDLIKAVESDIPFLIVGGGYQIFGQSYKDESGYQYEGIGAFNYYTECKGERIADYIVSDIELDGQMIQVVGFENHLGRTYNIFNSLGKVIHGIGNNEEDNTEGIKYKNVIGTYIQGPLLARNPELTDIIIKRMCKKNGYDVSFPDSINRFEQKARQQILDELKNG